MKIGRVHSTDGRPNTLPIRGTGRRAEVGADGTAALAVLGSAIPTSKYVSSTLSSVRGSSKAKSAHEWVSRHRVALQPHRGKWVAVTTSGIVGISDDFDLVYGEARRHGVSNPLVFKVPARRNAKIVSFKR